MVLLIYTSWALVKIIISPQTEQYCEYLRYEEQFARLRKWSGM
jgi:hypothetical protein